MQIQDLIEVGMECGGEAAGSGRFTGADFAGEQAGAVMIGQKLQPRFGLIPGLRREQLFGVGAVAEGRLFKTKKSSTMIATPRPSRYPLSCLAGRRSLIRWVPASAGPP